MFTLRKLFYNIVDWNEGLDLKGKMEHFVLLCLDFNISPRFIGDALPPFYPYLYVLQDCKIYSRIIYEIACKKRRQQKFCERKMIH